MHKKNKPTLGKPLILSASRRSDLPGFYSEQCADYLRLKIKRMKTRYLHSVVFWSKYVDAFIETGALHKLVKTELDNPFLHLTITGLGSTSFEPSIPSAEEILEKIPALINTFKKQPQRIIWRFDPVIISKMSIDSFIRIGSALAEHEIRNCIFSFPSRFSLKGSLDKTLNDYQIYALKHEEKQDYLSRLIPAAKALDIELRWCCRQNSEKQFYHIKDSACIDKDLLEKMHPKKLSLLLKKDFSQRKKCNCIQSEDIGDYIKHPCKGGCVYCYSKAGGFLG